MILAWKRPDYVRDLNASVAVSLLGEALHVAYAAVYGGSGASWKSLDVDERRSYIAFAKDMLENLHLEMTRDGLEPKRPA